MNKKLRPVFFLLAISVLNWLATALFGSEIDPRGCSWMAKSPNGRYIFAGICPRPIEDQIQFLRNRFPGKDSEISAVEAELRDIHRRFPEQGMYRNNGSNRPIWTMHEWQLEGMPTSDGERLVVPGRVADCFDDSLIARVYGPQGMRFDVTPSDIVPLYILWMLTLGNNETTPVYPDCSEMRLGLTGDTLVVTTSNGDSVELSLEDGRIIRSSLTKQAAHIFFTSPIGVGLSLLLVALICGSIWGFIRRKKGTQLFFTGAGNR